MFCVIYLLCFSCFCVTSWLLFVMFNCVFVTFPRGILGQVWYLIVWVPDLCHLTFKVFNVLEASVWFTICSFQNYFDSREKVHFIDKHVSRAKLKKSLKSSRNCQNLGVYKLWRSQNLSRRFGTRKKLLRVCWNYYSESRQLIH